MICISYDCVRYQADFLLEYKEINFYYGFFSFIIQGNIESALQIAF